MRPSAPRDPEPRAFEVPTGQVFACETGAGHPVVAVHGIPASSRDFRWLDAALDDRVHLYRLDLPGFGRSPLATAPAAVPDRLGEVVSDFCVAEDLRRVVLVAHSMGGPIAVDAATHTDRVAALVLVASAGPVLHRGIFPRTYRVMCRVSDTHRLLRRGLTSVTRPVLHAIGFSKRLTDDELLWGARLCGNYRNDVMAEQLAALQIPVVVAWAPDDRTVQEAVPQSILAAAPHAERLRFDDGGHNLQASRSIELADAIVDLCERVGRL